MHGAIDAWMPPLDFTVWQNEFQRLTDHLYAADVAEATERLGRRPLSGELARDGARRRSNTMLLWPSAPPPSTARFGPSRFVVTMHGDTDLVAQLLDVLFEALDTADDTDFDLDEALDRVEVGPDSLHELEDGTVISLNTLLLGLLTGTIAATSTTPTACRCGSAGNAACSPSPKPTPCGPGSGGAVIRSAVIAPEDVSKPTAPPMGRRWPHGRRRSRRQVRAPQPLEAQHQAPPAPRGIRDDGRRRTPPQTGP